MTTVLEVLTVKQSDSLPELSMTVDQMNDATDQPLDDALWSGYNSSDFADATRIELHMDYIDPDTDEFIRVVDGRQCTWDGANDEVTCDLNRDDTSRIGEYRFEWVLVYDDGAPNSADATDVDTVPARGFFELTVTESTSRDLAEADSPDRTVGVLTIEDSAVVNGPLDVEFQRHNTELTQDWTVPSGQGTVVAGPLTGTGSISGNGQIVVLEPDAEQRGTGTFTGDGTTTSFSVAHNLSGDPSWVDITPKTQAAGAHYWVTTDSTNITVNYASAPADQAAIEFDWEAEL